MIKILAITSDPVSKIHGYSYAFQKNMICLSRDFELTLLLNKDGKSYNLIEKSDILRQKTNVKFYFINLESRFYFIKAIEFIFKCLDYSEKFDILISNGELPEMITGFILSKFENRKSMVFIYDDSIRSNNIIHTLIRWLRIKLARKYDNILFLNEYTMFKFIVDKKTINKCFIAGSVVCDSNGKPI